MSEPCPHCGVDVEWAEDGRCPLCGQDPGLDYTPGGAGGYDTRRLLWLTLFPLALAVAGLVVGLFAAPDEGGFMMVDGRGGRVSQRENADFLQKLRDAGYNVPRAAIEESRQRAAVDTNRRALATVAYTVAAASALAAVLGFAFGGGPGLVKRLVVRRRPPGA